MKNTTFLRTGLSVLAFGASLAAQGLDHPDRTLATTRRDGQPDAQAAARALAADAAFWRVPIHTQVDDPVFGAYGWWAGNRDYKVSFHDGFVFYPYLGPDYPENLPLRWTTTRVTAGGEPIADLRAPRSSHGETRWEYRFDGVTEAYDVRDDGVEQTFVIENRPAQAGDLVVEGRVQTRLVPAQPVLAAQHGELTFADAHGTPIIRYGAAFAVDALGDKTPVTTSLQGDVVRLTVPGAWLASARFPITIDPLTSRSVIYGVVPYSLGWPSIHREDESTDYNVMFAAVRVMSGNDYDIIVHLGRDDLTQMGYVFADYAADIISTLPDVSFVGGADRWVVGFWRHNNVEDRVRAYFHDKGSLFYNSGVLATNHNPGTEHASFPAVGGTSHPTVGTTALMVYRSDPYYGNSPTSQIFGVGLDAVNRTFTSPRVRVSDWRLDAESPDVTCQVGWNDNGWIVAWQGRTDAADDFDIYVSRISTGIGWMGESQIGPDGFGDKAHPVVQGWDGHYLVAMLQDITPEINGFYFGRNIWVERFDWENFNGLPTRRGPRMIEARATQELTQLDLAFDGWTSSNWCLVAEQTGPRCLVRRLGYTGAVTESAEIEGGAYGRYTPAVAWNGLRHEFPIVYGSTEANVRMAGQVFQYRPYAWNVAYGNGCGYATIGSDVPPILGNEYFRVNLTAAPPGQPAILLLGSGSTSIELNGIGAPNCWLNVLPIITTVPLATNGAGACSFTFAIPEDTAFVCDLYSQYIYGWPARPHPLEIGTTRGMQTHVQQ